MSKIALNELHKEILFNLTKKELLDRINILEEKMQSLILNKNFIGKLSIMTLKKNITCEDVKELCFDMLVLICDDLPENWLEFVYSYLLNKNFPYKFTNAINYKYDAAVLVFLEILRIVIKYAEENSENKEYNFNLFISKSQQSTNQEFNDFREIYIKTYMYEMIFINAYLKKSNLLEFIKGIWKLSVDISKDLVKAGINSNTELVSYAAIGHFLGKISLNELDKASQDVVLYETKFWFEKNKLIQIGNIALFESMPNAYIENIPVEKLILMYSNLRIDINAEGKIKYNSINEIIAKLSLTFSKNEEQINSYVEKIKNFESYLNDNGVKIDFSIKKLFFNKKEDVFLIGNEIADRFKSISVESNIEIMNKIWNNDTFEKLTELNEMIKDRNHMIIFLKMIDEYNYYLPERKKLIFLDILFNLIEHEDGEIRKTSAELLGKNTADFDKNALICSENLKSESSTQELWEKYFKIMVFSKQMEKESSFQSYDFVKSFFRNLVENDSDKISFYLDFLVKQFENSDLNRDVISVLLTSILGVSLKYYTKKQISFLFERVFNYLKTSDELLMLISLNYLDFVLKREDIGKELKMTIFSNLESINSSKNYSIDYVRFKILMTLNQEEKLNDEFKRFMKLRIKNISDIFLINLKSATHWIEKNINIDFLCDIVSNNENHALLFHVAAHFSNLIKVSEKEVVRKKAGKALLSIIDKLALDQRNEICVELIKGLEIEEYRYSKNIPNFLGKLFLSLHPKELDESIDEVERLFYNSTYSTSFLALKTLCIVVENYFVYRNIFEENDNKNSSRLKKVLGIIVSGLVEEDVEIKIDTLYLIGNQIFNSNVLDYDEKFEIFNIIGKKLLSLYDRKNDSDICFINRAISFNQIYKFLNNYYKINKQLKMRKLANVAYFNDVFNLFSIEDDFAVSKIVALGYEVFIDIDDFNWKKDVHSYNFRKRICEISIAQKFDVYIFPTSIKVNVATKKGLKKLNTIFSDQKVSLVSSFDSYNYNSMYNEKKNLIFEFKHIFLMSKNNEFLSKIETEEINKIKPKLKNGYEEIILNKTNYDELGESKQINIQIERAIKYISNSGVVKNKLKNKINATKRTFKIEVLENFTDNIVLDVGRYVFLHTDLFQTIGEQMKNKNIKILVARKNDESNKLLGFVAFHHVNASSMFREFKNIMIANFVRENTSGKVMIIDGIYVVPSAKSEITEKIILTETLVHCLKNDFTYALYCNTIIKEERAETVELIKSHGFVKLEIQDYFRDIYAVDMKFPVCLTLDIQTYIKETFSNNEKTSKRIEKSRKKLISSLIELYPNTLILSFDVEMLQQAVVEMLSEEMEKSTYNKNNDYLCVPMGNVLEGKVANNIATKQLLVEREYTYDTQKFVIKEYPFEAKLEDQIKTLSSFEKRIVLVDDVVNNCHEILGIDGSLKRNSIDVVKVIAGILSSNGKDILEMHGYEVDSTYFIPNLKIWIRESTLHPFIGGYSVQTSSDLKQQLIPSINHVLPYTTPNFVNGCSNRAAYNLSMVCLENSKEMFLHLESEFKNIYGKAPLLKDLGTLVKIPRVPSKGDNLHYDMKKKISSYIENDIENLIRWEKTIKS